MRSFKKTAAVLMLVSFIFATVSPAMAGGLANITDIEGGNGGMAKGNAATIYFGNYWQSAAEGYKSIGRYNSPEAFNANNYNYEGIKWRVLSNDARGTGNVFLLTDQALYADQFNSESVTTNQNLWGRDESTSGAGDGVSSEIRTTMNNTTATTFNNDGTVAAWGGFAGDAFSGKELGAVTETTHTIGGTAPKGECWPGYSDVISTEKIFLLSSEEAMNYDYGFTPFSSESEERKLAATDLAYSVNMYGNNNAPRTSDQASAWWSRSPKDEAATHMQVGGDSSGRVVDGGRSITEDSVSVRAALNLNQESVLFATAAAGGKGDVTAGSGFALDNYKGADGWKLTLKDTDIATPTIASAEVKGGDWDVNALAETAKTGDKTLNIAGSDQAWGGARKLSVTYSGATTGTNKYVSALLYDSTGANMLNYAKVASAETNASGTDVKVDLSNVAAGNYKVKFFGEEANGDYQTDYASELSDAYSILVTGETGELITTLKGDYANSGLTANLTDNASLGFESAKYDTKVSVGTGSGEIFGGTTIAGLNANENTTVTGFVNAEKAAIADGKQITANGIFVSDKYAAIGWGSVVNEENTVSVGSENLKRKIVYVADGVNDYDAVNVKQMKDYIEEHGGSGGGSWTAKVDGTNLTVASGSTLEFAAGDGIELLADSEDGNIITIKATGGSGNGTDANAVHYNADKTEISLEGANGTTIKNVAAGNADTDAVNVGQLSSLAASTNQAIGDLAASTNNALGVMQNELNSVSGEVREVGAISAALAGLHYVEPSGEEGDKFVGAVAYGNYRGESAGAIGVAYKPTPNFMLSASTSVGQNYNAYNAGASLKFGKGETAVTRAALQKQVKFVNEENKVLKDRVGKLESDRAEQGEIIKQLLERIEKLEKKQ